MIKIFGEVKTLSEWCVEYGLPERLVYKRYTEGCIGDELLDPPFYDVLQKSFVHQVWGGKWVTKDQIRKKAKKHAEPVRWNNKLKWVYVGKPYITI